jgi:hypothetical protein
MLLEDLPDEIDIRQAVFPPAEHRTPDSSDPPSLADYPATNLSGNKIAANGENGPNRNFFPMSFDTESGGRRGRKTREC